MPLHTAAYKLLHHASFRLQLCKQAGKKTHHEEVDSRCINVGDRRQVHNNVQQPLASGCQLCLCTRLVLAASQMQAMSAKAQCTGCSVAAACTFGNVACPIMLNALQVLPCWH